MNHWLRTLLFATVVVASLSAQTDSSVSSFPDSTYTVGRIIISGNAITKEYVIENEMTFHQGDLITHGEVEYSKQRIYSLRLFTKVSIDVLPDNDSSATILVQVSERWYFYPYPLVGFKDRDFSKLYYGAGVIHNNVGGRNVLLYGQFALGYDPFVSIGYADPLFESKHHIFFKTHAYYTEQRNKSLVSLQSGPNFDEERWGGDISVGKRFTLFSSLTTTLEYVNLHVSDNRSGRTLSPTGRDDFFSFSASYQYDTRDLSDYPRLGTFFTISISKIGVLNSVIDYQRYNLDLRRYIPIGSSVTVAGRAFTSLAEGGAIPNYGHVYFGYDERIRGYYRRILEGEQITGGTMEIHIPLITPGYFRIDKIPIEQFRDFRYALNFALFADAGTTWYREEPFALNRFFSGYGFGFHVILAYSAVGRIEYAIPYGGNVAKGQVLLELGAAL
jgi:outer membrane protein assembly factor BamA